MPDFKAVCRALIAGALALPVNILLLKTADLAGIVTAGGSFQRLARLWLSPLLVGAGVGDLWRDLALPAPNSVLFMLGFKIGAGLAMAALYAWIEPVLTGPWWRRGLLYALAVWLVNAGLILPLLGEGFAGIYGLTPAGMAAFAIAHTTFFLILAGVFSFSTHRSVPAPANIPAPTSGTAGHRGGGSRV